MRDFLQHQTKHSSAPILLLLIGKRQTIDQK